MKDSAKEETTKGVCPLMMFVFLGHHILENLSVISYIKLNNILRYLMAIGQSHHYITSKEKWY